MANTELDLAIEKMEAMFRVGIQGIISAVYTMTEAKMAETGPESKHTIEWQGQCSGPCKFCSHGHSGNHIFSDTDCSYCDNGICGGGEYPVESI